MTGIFQYQFNELCVGSKLGLKLIVPDRADAVFPRPQTLDREIAILLIPDLAKNHMPHRALHLLLHCLVPSVPEHADQRESTAFIVTQLLVQQRQLGDQDDLARLIEHSIELLVLLQRREALVQVLPHVQDLLYHVSLQVYSLVDEGPVQHWVVDS